MGNSKNEKQKYKDEDEQFWSKNHGQSVKYRRRLVAEREAKAEYEDGLKQMEEPGPGEDYMGCRGGKTN